MTKKLYLNLWEFKDNNYPFQIFLGGRGIGKTYSMLKGAISGEIPEGKRFLHMRRTADAWELQLDTDRGEGANPFKNINFKEGTNVGMKKMSKKLAGVYNRTCDEDGKLIHSGAPLGYAIALSTVASIRGIDFSDCSDLIYDEFCKEKHEKMMSGEADALLNAYESINRNREFDGEPPLRLWLLSNSSDIYNPIFVELGLVSICEQMQRKGLQHKYIEDRGLAIHLLESPEAFIEKKKRTALYRLTAGSSFEAMALNNEFAYNDFSLIEHKSLKGYQPMCSINNKAYFYRKKGSREIYISYAQAKCPNYDCKTEQDLRLFRSKYANSLMAYFVNSNVTFESYELKALVLDVLL